MINAEKYMDEILDKDCKFGLSNRICKCCYDECDTCVFSLENNPNDGLSNSCTIRKVKWLLSEYKEPIKLSRLEYEILKHVQKEGFNFITRNNCGNSIIHEIKPIKHDGSIGWCTTSKSYMLYAFNGLFKFVTSEDEKPTSIKDVLENCVVKEIEEEQ